MCVYILPGLPPLCLAEGFEVRRPLLEGRVLPHRLKTPHAPRQNSPHLLHFVELDGAFAYCPRFPTVVFHGSSGLVSVSMWLIILKDQLSIIGLVNLSTNQWSLGSSIIDVPKIRGWLIEKLKHIYNIYIINWSKISKSISPGHFMVKFCCTDKNIAVII